MQNDDDKWNLVLAIQNNAEFFSLRKEILIYLVRDDNCISLLLEGLGITFFTIVVGSLKITAKPSGG